MTPLSELEKTNSIISSNIKQQQRYAIAKDMYERFNDLQNKLTAEINTKVFITDWTRYNIDFKQDMDENLKQINKDASYTRERLDRTCRKLDDTALKLTNT